MTAVLGYVLAPLLIFTGTYIVTGCWVPLVRESLPFTIELRRKA